MPSTNSRLRLSIFAGPNGSGKSTIFNKIKADHNNQIPTNFGVYINADDIAKELQNGPLSFDQFQIKVQEEEFTQIALSSDLVKNYFDHFQFKRCYEFAGNAIKFISPEIIKPTPPMIMEAFTKGTRERFARIIAAFLRKKLLQEKRRFSFETVFSHASKLDFIKEAVAAGYKIDFYFISTESPLINISRVELRVRQGGHDVPRKKIIQRYYRSLNLLFEAAQLANHAYFFDNSGTNKESLFAHFKKEKGKKQWDPIDPEIVPGWFIKYYSEKVVKSQGF